MNPLELMKIFLEDNYSKNFVFRRNSVSLTWFEVRQQGFNRRNSAGRRVTIQIIDQSVKVWSFPTHRTVVGSLAGDINLADPDVFKMITDVISKRIGLKPSCQLSKAMILTKCET